MKVWLAMALLETGDNNGGFFFSDRKGAEMTGLSRNTVQKALKELIAKGFIYCSERGGFSRKTQHAAKYGFTWLAGPQGTERRAPRHDYENWAPHGNTRAQFLTETGSVSDTETETGQIAGPNTEPTKMEKRLVSANPQISETEPQTVYQGKGDPSGVKKGWKHANPDRAAFLASLRSALHQKLSNAPAGTQTTVANAVGIPGGTLSKFKNGGNLADDHASALARHLLKEAA